MEYKVTFTNHTYRSWITALYQTFDGSTDLDSVSWMQIITPANGSACFCWKNINEVILSDYQKSGWKQIYTPFQSLPASLGQAWTIVLKDQVQQMEQTGSASPDVISIDNQSGQLANAGIGMMNRGCVYKHSILSNTKAPFHIYPVYWFGLFDDLQEGEVISDNVIAGPVQLSFGSDANLTIDAYIEKDTLYLKVQDTVAASLSLDEIEDRIAQRRLLRMNHPE